jgi:hypothetical protein
MSLIDLCRIEKKNPLPKIPLLEEPVIFEEQSQDSLKCNISEMVREHTGERRLGFQRNPLQPRWIHGDD